MKKPEISIVIPCLNEEACIGKCIDYVKKVIKENDLNAEIIVVDNNSTDKSPEIIKKKRVNYVLEKEKGYGAAYLAGFEKARGKYLFMADADMTYDFAEIPRFIKPLKKEHDFVLGNRFAGKMQKKSMPFLHRYVGNPVLSGMLRLFFGTKLKDAHCGMRAITKEAYEKLNLRTIGMEFASEMIIKALKNNLKIKEFDIEYHPRMGDSKLNTFNDGWRHLRFMLIYSPIFLFLIPGLIIFLLGLVSMVWFYVSNPEILGIKFFYHPMFLSALGIIIGYQMIIFSGFAKTYAITHLGERSKIMERLYGSITIEKAGILGSLFIFLGAFLFFMVFMKWKSSGFGSLNEVKNSIVALTTIAVGFQTIFSGFMLSMLGIKEK